MERTLLDYFETFMKIGSVLRTDSVPTGRESPVRQHFNGISILSNFLLRLNSYKGGFNTVSQL